MLLASNGQRLGMLLNTLRCSVQSPQHRVNQPYMSVTPSWRNSDGEWSWPVNRPCFWWETFSYRFYYLTVKFEQGLPWWYSSEESVLQCRVHRFDPWSGKIPDASEPLSLRTRLQGTHTLEPGLHDQKPVHRNQRKAPAEQRKLSTTKAK